MKSEEYIYIAIGMIVGMFILGILIDPFTELSEFYKAGAPVDQLKNLLFALVPFFLGPVIFGVLLQLIANWKEAAKAEADANN
jgi:uncharacterized membrane protein YczE